MKTKIIYILIVIIALNSKIFAQKNEVIYDSIKTNNAVNFIYPDTLNNLYLRELRNKYALESLISQEKGDLKKVLSVLDWTHKQWKHNGNNEPSKSDALTILKEVKDGKKYRCVEYGIVSTSALLSLNYKARILGLMIKEVETSIYGAGHVLAEVWLPEYEKWAMIDGQFNIMPILNEIPLNAVEFQAAINQNKEFKLINILGEVSTKNRKNYLSFIYNYLFYLNTSFDKKELEKDKRMKIENKTHLFLVPVNANNPRVFQGIRPIDYGIYTNSINDFYKKPF